MYTALKALYIHFVSGVIILNASVSYPFEKRVTQSSGISVPVRLLFLQNLFYIVVNDPIIYYGTNSVKKRIDIIMTSLHYG